MRITAYIRVSTDEQVTSGVSMDAQRQTIERWCESNGHGQPTVFADQGVSGGAGIEKRPGLLDALDSLKRGGALVVVKRDRLARDVFLACWIEKEAKRHGARIVSLAGEGSDSDNPADVLMRRLIDAFAEYERAVIRARTKAALAHKKANGERIGTMPFGHDLADDGVSLTENGDEQAVITDMRAMRAEGKKLHQIATTLSERGVRTKTGKRQWGARTVHAILRRTG